MSKTITRRAFLKTSSLVTLGIQIPALRALPREAEFRIGITTNTRGGWEKDLIKSFREASEVGYRAVETFYSFVQPYWEKPEEMKKILADLNLRFVTVSNGGPMVMQFEDPSKEKQIIEEHVKLVRWIKGFGCTHLKINTGRRRPEGTTEEDLKQMAKTMNELGKRISDEGLKLGFMPISGPSCRIAPRSIALWRLPIQSTSTWCSTPVTSRWPESILWT